MPVNREIRPTGHIVLGTRLATAMMSPGGLHLPEGYTERHPTHKARVTHVGAKCEEVQVGDIIVFAPHHGSDVEIDSTTYFIINEEMVLCVLRDTELVQ